MVSLIFSSFHSLAIPTSMAKCTFFFFFFFTMEDSYVDSAMRNIWIVPFYHFPEFLKAIYMKSFCGEYNVLIIERWRESGLLSFKTL